MFYLRLITLLPPLNLISKVDLLYSLNQYISPADLLLGIGPTAILALFGAWLAIKKGREWAFLLAPWAVVYPLGFFFVYRIVGCNSARFLQTPFFVILGILSTFALNKLAKLLNRKIIFLMALFLLIPNLPAYRQSFIDTRLNFSHFHPYINTSPQMVSAFEWLEQNSQESEIVLASPTNGMLITALSGNFAYSTLFAQALDNYPQMESNIQQFLSQQWPKKQAETFIVKENIKFIFFSPEEKKLGGKTDLTWPFLVPAFENSEVTIYRTQF